MCILEKTEAISALLEYRKTRDAKKEEENAKKTEKLEAYRTKKLDILEKLSVKK